MFYYKDFWKNFETEHKAMIFSESFLLKRKFLHQELSFQNISVIVNIVECSELPAYRTFCILPSVWVTDCFNESLIDSVSLIGSVSHSLVQEDIEWFSVSLIGYGRHWLVQWVTFWFSQSLITLWRHGLIQCVTNQVSESLISSGKTLIDSVSHYFVQGDTDWFIVSLISSVFQLVTDWFNESLNGSVSHSFIQESVIISGSQWLVKWVSDCLLRDYLDQWLTESLIGSVFHLFD